MKDSNGAPTEKRNELTQNSETKKYTSHEFRCTRNDGDPFFSCIAVKKSELPSKSSSSNSADSCSTTGTFAKVTSEEVSRMDNLKPNIRQSKGGKWSDANHPPQKDEKECSRENLHSSQKYQQGSKDIAPGTNGEGKRTVEAHPTRQKGSAFRMHMVCSTNTLNSKRSTAPPESSICSRGSLCSRRSFDSDESFSSRKDSEDGGGAIDAAKCFSFVSDSIPSKKSSRFRNDLQATELQSEQKSAVSICQSDSIRSITIKETRKMSDSSFVPPKIVPSSREPEDQPQQPRNESSVVNFCYSLFSRKPVEAAPLETKLKREESTQGFCASTTSKVDSRASITDNCTSKENTDADGGKMGGAKGKLNEFFKVSCRASLKKKVADKASQTDISKNSKRRTSSAQEVDSTSCVPMNSKHSKTAPDRKCPEVKHCENVCSGESVQSKQSVTFDKSQNKSRSGQAINICSQKSRDDLSKSREVIKETKNEPKSGETLRMMKCETKNREAARDTNDKSKCKKTIEEVNDQPKSKEPLQEVKKSQTISETIGETKGEPRCSLSCKDSFVATRNDPCAEIARTSFSIKSCEVKVRSQEDMTQDSEDCFCRDPTCDITIRPSLVRKKKTLLERLSCRKSKEQKALEQCLKEERKEEKRIAKEERTKRKMEEKKRKQREKEIRSREKEVEKQAKEREKERERQRKAAEKERERQRKDREKERRKEEKQRAAEEKKRACEEIKRRKASEESENRASECSLT